MTAATKKQQDDRVCRSLTENMLKSSKMTGFAEV